MSLSSFRWQRLTVIRALLCLVLALTGAQVLALAHELQHLAEQTPDEPLHEPGVGTAAQSPCGLCLTGHAAAGPGLVTAALQLSQPAPNAAQACVGTDLRTAKAERPVYRSQAPPRQC